MLDKIAQTFCEYNVEGPEFLCNNHKEALQVVYPVTTKYISCSETLRSTHLQAICSGDCGE